MKKTLILAGILAMTMTSVYAAEQTVEQTLVQPAQQVETVKPEEYKLPPKRPDFKKCECPKCKKAKCDCVKKGPKADFEKRLKLTDEQKAQAEELRKKGHEEMKPIMEQIRLKHQEIEAVKLSRMATQMQEEKIAQLKKEIQELKGQAKELRQQNMKDFEAILTKKQQKELKKMKEEGRKRFEQARKEGHHPCQCDCCGKRPHHPGHGPRPFPGPQPQPGIEPAAPAPAPVAPVAE